MAFDPEGVFDGKPSLFVSSLSQADPTKNADLPDRTGRVVPGGVYIQFTAGSPRRRTSSCSPRAVFVPPVEQQSFLKGLFVGQGNGSSANNGTSSTGQLRGAVLRRQHLPARPEPQRDERCRNGVTLTTPFSFGPQIGFTAANSSYSLAGLRRAFTDFGTPGAGGVAAAPGL